MSAFAGLLPSLQATLKAEGLTTPTDIQTRAIPALLAGKSVIGLSETGSGKTLAFALPVLHLLKTMEAEGNPVAEAGRPRAVAVVPTRELGEQVTRAFKPFTHTTRLRVRSALGGAKYEAVKRNVEGCFEVLVATPGRLLQLMEAERVGLGDVRLLVFDEADRMLDRGFLPDAQRIAGACPPGRQMALFSATVPPPVQALMGKLFAGAELIRSDGSHRIVPTLKTVNLDVPNGKRFPLLEDLLSEKVDGGTLVFTNTRRQCDDLAALIRETGRPCRVYRGEMDKVERRANLKAFREGDIDLLVSTDLGSRGLDLEQAVRVINLVTERDAGLIAKLAALREPGA